MARSTAKPPAPDEATTLFWHAEVRKAAQKRDRADGEYRDVVKRCRKAGVTPPKQPKWDASA